MTNARAADGSLPVITFMHLVGGDPLTGLGCFVVPPAPGALIATAGNSQVTLNWTASTNATGYNVKRALISGGSYTNIAGNVTATNYTDTGLNNGTTYYYIVTALNPGDESTNSIQASTTTIIPLPPQFSNITATGANFIFNGTGGVSNGTYYVLGSTNFNLPLAQWTRLATNNFDAGGNFNFTNFPVAGLSQQFYLLQLP
jgi:hypothetical protein